jgi:hypothetical protein
LRLAVCTDDFGGERTQRVSMRRFGFPGILAAQGDSRKRPTYGVPRAASSYSQLSARGH